ncbi:GNAT family N-acetyltransferase [Streptomyces sp. NPDC056084]|uniref:GNAT family N-acetyltransferase n=1 Tax=unclassified Streptomyces TaxID=2593676 RepID=UPI0035E112A4
MTTVEDMNVEDMNYEFRTARREDTEGIEALDGSFTTHTVFHVSVTGAGSAGSPTATTETTGSTGSTGSTVGTVFALREVPVDPPIRKIFPLDDTDDEGDSAPEDNPNLRTVVAIDANECLAGYVVVSFDSWNRRLTIVDVTVAPAHRGRGVGRTLMGHAAEFARERGATHIWLEVTNINAPAIHAYQRMGFTFCGLDTTLYDGTPSAGEQALYMSMPCL